MKKFLLGIIIVCTVSIIATSCSKDDEPTDKCYSCVGDGGLLGDVPNICEGDKVLTASNMSIQEWVDGYETSGGTCTEK